jgi:Phytanoyl-CoA dioxygenase (PhyH)
MTAVTTQQPRRELRTSDGLRGNREALKARMEADGYLFFRSALPAPAVARLRGRVLTVLREHGFVDEGDQGVWTGRDLSPFGTHPPELHDLRLWQEFVAHPGVAAFFEELVGESVFWVPIAQYRFTAPTLPGDGDPYSGRHQDGFYNESIPFRTAWIPLVDIDDDVGGLAVVPGWHRRGWLHDLSNPPIYPIKPDTIPRNAWRRSNYHPGDVVIFDRHTPHAGLPNHSDRLRLSIDVRAMPASGPIPIVGEIAAVGVGDSTVTVRDQDGREMTVSVDENTYIRVEKGRRITLSELRVGTPALVGHEDGRAIVVRKPT